jgi:hypothetical protein
LDDNKSSISYNGRNGRNSMRVKQIGWFWIDSWGNQHVVIGNREEVFIRGNHQSTEEIVEKMKIGPSIEIWTKGTKTLVGKRI